MLAARVGLATPEWTLHRASEKKSVLILDRFDRAPNGGRRAYLSAASALGIGANDLSRYTYEQFSDVVNDLIADAFSLRREEGARIIRSVARQVQTWPDIANELEIPERQRRRLARAFDVDRIDGALALA